MLIQYWIRLLSSAHILVNIASLLLFDSSRQYRGFLMRAWHSHGASRKCRIICYSLAVAFLRAFLVQISVHGWHLKDYDFSVACQPCYLDLVEIIGKITMKVPVSTASLLCALMFASTFVESAETKIIYKYDALGRLTFIEDSANGNRDYDYDDVGNRKLVSVNQSVDEPAPLPTPSAPSIPSDGCAQQYPNVYRAKWYSVSGASYYILRSTASQHRVTGTSFYIDQGGRPAAGLKPVMSKMLAVRNRTFNRM